MIFLAGLVGVGGLVLLRPRLAWDPLLLRAYDWLLVAVLAGALAQAVPAEQVALRVTAVLVVVAAVVFMALAGLRYAVALRRDMRP